MVWGDYSLSGPDLAVSSVGSENLLWSRQRFIVYSAGPGTENSRPLFRIKV